MKFLPALKSGSLKRVPPGLSEMEISRLMLERAEMDGRYLNFIGAGAYEHHIPAAVWQITTRGEFYSSYTPYQAEASQGTLQLLYEYQTDNGVADRNGCVQCKHVRRRFRAGGSGIDGGALA